MSPQAYLDVMIHSRGYSTRRYRTLQTGYYSKPTDYQQASYHVNLVKLVRNHQVEEFRNIVSSGISPNPCNAYGESLLHMVCRRGDADLLRIMLDVGSCVQVADDYGRTPLHDACWAATPSFETVELIASRDITLFHMTDSRGAVPLSYVRREHWPEWIEFLESKKDTWWPPIRGADQPSVLVDIAPNERPIPKPANAFSNELAGMVASGVMTPEEAKLLTEEDDEEEDDSESDDDSCSDDEDEDSDDDDDDDEDDDDSEEDSDEEESSSMGEEDDLAALGMNMDDMREMMKRVNYAKQAVH
jgi:Ankyrin repeats (3 copies)